MTDDVTALVERIRPHKLTGDDAGIYMKARLAREAADALERLSAQVAELEEMLMQELSDIGQEIEREATYDELPRLVQRWRCVKPDQCGDGVAGPDCPYCEPVYGYPNTRPAAQKGGAS